MKGEDADMDRLRALIAKWRAEGARMDTVHATMGTGYHACADELEAALAAEPPPVLFDALREAVRALDAAARDDQPYGEWDGAKWRVFNAAVRLVKEPAADPPPGPDWQPITTAPTDGTVIRLKRVYRRALVKDGPGFFGNVTIGYAAEDGGPQTYQGVWVDGDRQRLFPEPTHWMPLPEAPPVKETP